MIKHIFLRVSSLPDCEQDSEKKKEAYSSIPEGVWWGVPRVGGVGDARWGMGVCGDTLFRAEELGAL